MDMTKVRFECLLLAARVAGTTDTGTKETMIYEIANRLLAWVYAKPTSVSAS